MATKNAKQTHLKRESTSKLTTRKVEVPRRRRVVQTVRTGEAFDELPDRFRVRAHKLGLHDHKRRRVNDVFIVERQNFNPSWMERVAQNTPLRQTTGAQELKQRMSEIAREKRAERTGEKLGPSAGMQVGRDDVDNDMPDDGMSPLGNV